MPRSPRPALFVRKQAVTAWGCAARTLPLIARQDVFALNGATNFFYRDMPRLSVDIDRTYLPVEDRNATLAGIDPAFDHIREDILRALSR